MGRQNIPIFFNQWFLQWFIARIFIVPPINPPILFTLLSQRKVQNLWAVESFGPRKDSCLIFRMLIAEFNPFDMRRSAGFGLRVFLPMFGLLGFDYGWGWDKPALIQSNAKWSEFGKFSLILGFEPD